MSFCILKCNTQFTLTCYCSFIGTCIGERNHCRFFWFITIQALGFTKCVSIVNSSRFGVISFLKPVFFHDVDPVDIWMVILAKFYLYPLSFAAWMIVGVHSWFVVTNGTTFEIEKGNHLEYLEGTSACDLPFSSGLLSNLKLFCCTRDASSKWLSYIGITNREIQWTPILWKPVGTTFHDSDDWQNNLWSNKYWSCC